MRILVTNDDGIHSPGFEAIRRALEPDHDVWVLAPDSERSAMSHYITVKDPVSCRRLDEATYISNGSPADCVIVGMLGALPIVPEMVVSGINIGANLGSDIIYSGTAAAARQAAIMGVPGFALSLDGFRDPLYFEPFAEFVAQNLDELFGLWNREHFININCPNIPDREKPVVITSPAVRFYNDRLASFKAPSGEMYYFLDGTPAQTELQPGTDWHAVSDGKISVSPIYLNPINHRDDMGYQSASFLRPEYSAVTEGIRLLRQKRYQQALEAFRNSDADPVEDAELAYYMGLCYAQLDEFDEALFHLEQVVESELGLAYLYQARMVLGYIYAVTGRYRLAEFEFNKLLEEGFESPKEYAALGYALYAQGRVSESVSYLERALEIDPENANALNSLGYILAEHGERPQDALRYCKKACGLIPDNPSYLDSLGWAFYATGNLEESRKTLRRALELSPKNRDIAMHLKQVMQRIEA